MEYKFTKNKKFDDSQMDWIRSDDLQIVRRLGEDVFELAEVHRETLETVNVLRATINLNDYSDEEVSDYLSAYGYSGIKAVEKLYPDDAKQIIAECIFESLLPDEYDAVSDLFYDEDKAAEYLSDIEKNDVIHKSNKRKSARTSR